MVLESLEKNSAEQSLPSTNASKNSAGSDGTIKRTPKLKGKRMEREELQKDILLKTFQVDLARFVTAFFDRGLAFASIVSAEYVNYSWYKIQFIVD